MQAKDVMTAGVECVGPDETLQNVARRMRDKDVGSFPVCDHDRLAGMITDRDIAIRCVADGADCTTATVRDAMSPGIVFCFEDQDMAEVADLMRKHQVRRLPVLDASKRMTGIIAMADMALEAHDREAEVALEGVSRPK